MTDVAMGYATAEDEIADLRSRLNAALEDSSIAETGRLEALRERIRELEAENARFVRLFEHAMLSQWGQLRRLCEGHAC